ncbi:MAG: rod shape-determining protein MreC [Blastocatellia bacterium]
MSLTDKAKDKAKKNPTWLLGLLLVAHLIAISFNRVPDRPYLSYLQLVTMSGMTPFQWVASHSAGGVKGIWNDYFDLRGTRQKNQELTERITKLEADNNEFKAKATVAEQVASLNQAATSYPGVIARVIGHDANQWFSTIVIDRGTASGVEKDQPVITADGLVGRVILAGPISSQVLLITDERHGAGAAVVARTSQTRWLGILEGKNKMLCDMRFIVPPEKLEPGEEVKTSGQDGLYPADLLIGRIKAASPLAAPVLVEIEPAAQLGKLDMVKALQVPMAEIRRPIQQLKDKEEQEKQERATDRKK